MAVQVGISDNALTRGEFSGHAANAHPNLSRKAGIDPKLVADQLGHGLGVNLDVYTISDLGQRLVSVNLLEQSLASPSIN